MPAYYRLKKKFGVVRVDEIQKYIDAAQTIDMKVLLSLAWLSGQRMIQMLRLHRNDISIEKDGLIISYSAAKHGKETTHVYGLDDPYVQYIIAYITTRDGIIFPLCKRSYQSKLLKINKLIYPDNKEQWLIFHYFRHARITHWIRNLGLQPAEVKDLTGHKSTAYEEYFQVQKAAKIKGRYGEGL